MLLCVFESYENDSALAVASFDNACIFQKYFPHYTLSLFNYCHDYAVCLESICRTGSTCFSCYSLIPEWIELIFTSKFHTYYPIMSEKSRNSCESMETKKWKYKNSWPLPQKLVSMKRLGEKRNISAALKVTVSSVASINHEWKTFGTTRTLPRVGCLASLSNSQGVHQRPNGHWQKSSIALWREENFPEGQVFLLHSTQACMIQWPDGSDCLVKGTW